MSNTLFSYFSHFHGYAISFSCAGIFSSTLVYYRILKKRLSFLGGGGGGGGGEGGGEDAIIFCVQYGLAPL